MTRLAAITAAVLVVTAGRAATAELVTNGDFADGNTGFASGHTFTPGMNGLEAGPNRYAIGDNPQFHHGRFFSFPDHTPDDNGLMFIANSFGTTVWEQSFAVAQNADYGFSAWVRLAFGEAVPILSVQVNNVPLNGGAVFSSLSGSDWTEQTRSWNSGLATTATLRIVNASNENGGNDFALDDISFVGPAAPTGAIPEPATWAMMLAGFGGMGALLRRRREALA